MQVLLSPPTQGIIPDSYRTIGAYLNIDFREITLRDCDTNLNKLTIILQHWLTKDHFHLKPPKWHIIIEMCVNLHVFQNTGKATEIRNFLGKPHIRQWYIINRPFRIT